MIGTITRVLDGFGFIADDSGRTWYFSFYELKPGSLTPRESMKVSFDRKNDSQKFKHDLEAGVLKDSVDGYRNPKLKKTQRRGHGMPIAPSAAKVEVLAEQRSDQ